MRRWGLFVLILAVLAALPCLGQPAGSPGAEAARTAGATGTPGQAETRDREEHWRIGIAAFDASRAAPRNAYLAHSIPLQLRERLETVPAHHFDEEGRLAAARSVLREAIRELAVALEKLRAERDELLFAATAGRAEKIEEYDRRISRNLESMQRLRQTPAADVQVPDSKPIRFMEGGDGQLMEQAVRSAVEAVRESRLDLLVWGSVEQLEDYLYVEAHAFDAARGREVFAFREASGVEGVQELVAALGEQLARLVWGREWASVSIQTEPTGALVWVNEQFVGRAPVHLEFVLPGRAKLRVASPGYGTAEEEIDLPAYSRTEHSVPLAAVATQTLSLESVPEGAEVYAGADWVGRTPLQITRPEGANRLLLRKDGYLDTSLYLNQPGEDAASALSVALLPQQYDPRAEQLSRRDSFYRAFGLFALSVPLPFFFWAFAGDNAVGYVGSLDPELWDAAQGYYAAYLGSLALSAGLFANALVRLLRYVRAANRRA